MPLSCQDGDRAGWRHTIARFTPSQLRETRWIGRTVWPAVQVPWSVGPSKPASVTTLPIVSSSVIWRS
jgi:hypothetical protein